MAEGPPPPSSSDRGGDTQTLTAYTAAAANAPAHGVPGAFTAFNIGRYRVLRLIGQGGMGAVYEAEQEHPHRTVALKVIKAGLAMPDLLRRFEQEAQALGRLQHPGIAQIYEAGTAETGGGPQPFFAMELVSGRPLTAFARDRGLGTRERLELLARVCDAVHHAHQRGIIHRDLKPANILVDESGQPKVLDFGVARVTDSDAQATRQTDVGQLIGTLAYMSPEQVLADPLEIDTRSDVYALGLILYELLAGRLPYKTERTRIHEAVQAISEEEPPALGTIDRSFRGDIETIVARAIEKDKTRRYSSAASLASDIRRHLNDEPIVARPATTAYQLQKFARRHRAFVTGIAAVFVVLVAGVLASTWQAIRATRAEQTARQAESLARSQRDRATAAEAVSSRERDAATQERDRATRAEAEARQQRDQTLAEKRRADEEAATARAVNEFLQTDLLAQADTNTQTIGKPDPDIKARTLLDRAAEHVAGRFADKPRVDASIEATIGRAYRGLGLFPEAERHLSRAFNSYSGSVGREHPETLSTAETLGELYRTMGRYADAESLLEKTVESLRRTQGAGNARTLYALSGLASVYVAQGKYAKATPLLVESFDLERRTLGPDHATTVETMQQLARLEFVRGNVAEAERLLREVIEIGGRTLNPDHPRILGPMNSLAVVYQSQFKFAEAEELYTTLLETSRRVRGPEHPDTLNAMNNLGALDTDQGKFGEAESLYLKVLEGWRKQFGPEHPRTLTLLSNLAFLYQVQGKYAKAESTGIQVLGVRRQVLGPDHPDTLESMHILAGVYAAEQKVSAAESLYLQTLEARRRVLGPRHARTTDSMASLGEVKNGAGKYAEAEPLLRECLQIQKETAPDDFRRFRTETLLGDSLLHQRKYAEAESILLSGYEGLKQRETRMPASRRPKVREAGAAIVALYDAWGQPAQAARWREQLTSASK
jgi:tetratricopeptide (TPR) repeat protein